MIARCFIQRSSAFVPLARFQRTLTTALRVELDSEGRTIRTKSREDVADDNGWDDFDPLSDKGQKRTQPPPRGSDRQRSDVSSRSGNWGDGGSRMERRDSGGRGRSDGRGRVGGRDSGGRGRSEPRGEDRWGERRESRFDNDNGRREDRGGGRGGRFSDRSGPTREPRAPDDKRINMQALEGAGFVHLYGLASCLNALRADRRDFTNPEDLIDLETLSGEALEHEKMQRERKPEAKFSPHLFVQDRAGSRGERALEKAMAAEELERLAGERGIPIATVDKGVLNALSGNRPHQGYVLRCGKLEFDSMPRLSMQENSPKLWLVLDEVVDPQNLGALLRSAYFMGGSKIGVMVCAKNSAPPSPVVSAASAGALELLEVYSTSNLPRTLNAAREEGFRIIGASSDIPNADAQVYDLNELPSEDRPTLLVLGSEGLGLRTLVAKACTDFVKIPGQDDSGVDSLNVSVTGGILLWHLLNK